MIHAGFPSHIGYPVRLEVGRGSYGVEGLKILAYGGAERLRVGNFTSVGPGATVLLGGEHRAAPAFLFFVEARESGSLGRLAAGYEWTTTFPFPAFDPRAARLAPAAHATSKGDVVLGSDVFVGAGATILSGVCVGDGAVVGAGAVVAKDVRPYAVVVGNPAREVRRRFNDATVGRLLEDPWWKWPDDEVVENFAALMAPPVPG